MQSLPFAHPGRFWRGNLHTHSTRSDGTLSPEEVCRLYRENGYDFVSLTDHYMEIYEYPIVDTRAYHTDAFTTLLGAELHGPQIESGSPWHLVANGLPQSFTMEPSDSGPDLARRAMQAGAFVTVAHPQWYTLTEADILSLDAFHAIEVFNGVAVDHNDRPDGWHMAETMLGRRLRFGVTAADDFHGLPGMWDHMRGWVWVKSEELTPEALLMSLKAGRYYSSTGPIIHDVSLSSDGSMISVSCSPAERVFVSGKGSAVAAIGGRGLTAVDIDLSGLDSPYARITVRDAQGGRAWTNPFWFDSL